MAKSKSATFKPKPAAQKKNRKKSPAARPETLGLSDPMLARLVAGRIVIERQIQSHHQKRQQIAKKFHAALQARFPEIGDPQPVLP